MTKEIELSISCNDCVRRGTPDCSDCLVTFVLGETPNELVMTSHEAEVVQLFTAEGLLPTLKYHRATH
ncbi:MAG TPA: hypothetical protein VGZ04_02020 [Acidimicrobiales bacterium]|jgi:hypothetical protein|nr:hypothetical protein [Acidimicrobiales bacterium]